MQTYFILLSLFGGYRLTGWSILNVVTQYVITLDKSEPFSICFHADGGNIGLNM